MVVCSVFGCKSNNNKRLKRNQVEKREIEQTKFFRFPKEESMQKVWLFKCGRKDKFNVKNAYICSKHFTPEQYFRNLMHELLHYSPKNSKKLKSDAIPTLNLPFSSAAGESKRQERKHKRDRKQIVQEILSSAVDEPDPENLQVCSTIVEIQEPSEQRLDNLKMDKSTNTEDLKETHISKQMNELIAKNKRLMQENHALRQETKYIDQIFTPGQRRKLQANCKRIKWDVKDISSAYEIYSSGPKAYSLLLEKHYPLPAVITLRKWAHMKRKLNKPLN